MTREQVNQLNYRPLKKGGNRFNRFIEQTDCKVFEKGKGDPVDILTAMVGYASKYAYQVHKLAQYLEKTSLAATVTAFYEFQRNYIQYDVDGYKQRLRTPSCLWSERLTGGDCKSFAIFSAALCSSIGIKVYMRQVKVAGTEHENKVNHVYCVVPVDQKSGSLTRGYYVLDSSAKQNVEVQTYWENDMEVLPYYGMNNAAQATQITSCGCGCGGSKKSSCSGNPVKNERFIALAIILNDLVNMGANPKTMERLLFDFGKIVKSNGNAVLATDSCNIYLNGQAYSIQGVDTTSGMNFTGLNLGNIGNLGSANSGVGLSSGNLDLGGIDFNNPSSNSGVGLGTGGSGGGFDLGGALGGVDLGALLGGGGDLGSALGGTAGTVGGALIGGPLGAQLGGALGTQLGGLFTGGTGACGLVFENERKKGDAFFHNAKITMKWRDAEHVLNFFDDSLLNYGWSQNHCPSSPAQGVFKRGEDAFYAVLAPFLDAVLMQQVQLPESFVDDTIIEQYLVARYNQVQQQSGSNQIGNNTGNNTGSSNNNNNGAAGDNEPDKPKTNGVAVAGGIGLLLVLGAIALKPSIKSTTTDKK